MTVVTGVKNTTKYLTSGLAQGSPRNCQLVTLEADPEVIMTRLAWMMMSVADTANYSTKPIINTFY